MLRSKKIKVAMLVVCAVFMSNCAHKQPIHLSQITDLKKTVSTCDVHENKVTKKIYPAVPMSNVSGFMGGGLIPALIDIAITDSRLNDANNSVESLNKIIDATNIDKEVSEKFNHILQTQQWLKIEKHEKVVESENIEYVQNFIKNSKADFVLDFATKYSISIDRATVTGVMVVFLTTKNEKIKEKLLVTHPNSNGNFSAIVTYNVPLKRISSCAKENIRQWAQNDAQEAREAIAKINEELSSIINSYFE